MLCFRYKKLLIPYSEGGLSERAREKVERHLAGCERCAADLGAIHSVSCTLKAFDAPAMEPAPDLWARVSARVADEPAPRKPVYGRLVIAGTACAAVVVAMVGFSLLRGPQMTPTMSKARHLPSSYVALRSPSSKLDEAREAAGVPAPAKPATVDSPVRRTWTEAKKPVVASVGGNLSEGTTEGVRVAPAPPVMARRAEGEVRVAYADMTAVGGRFIARDKNVADGNVAAARIAAVPDTPHAHVYNYSANTPAEVSATSGSKLATYGHAAVPAATPAPALAPAGTVFADADSDTASRTLNAVRKTDESVVDTLNETEGVRTAAIFTYP